MKLEFNKAAHDEKTRIQFLYRERVRDSLIVVGCCKSYSEKLLTQFYKIAIYEISSTINDLYQDRPQGGVVFNKLADDTAPYPNKQFLYSDKEIPIRVMYGRSYEPDQGDEHLLIAEYEYQFANPK